MASGSCAAVNACGSICSNGGPGEQLPVRRWYAILEPGTLAIDEREAAERFGALLTESVRLHLRSDVPVGTCLSGGLDSSSIVCLMARELEAEGGGARVNTVSACYDVKAVDERPFMEDVVRDAACLPHWCHPRVEDAFAQAERITWHQDEPYGSTSIFAQWCVFAEARGAGIKVMLDGQGADEQLAGYHGGFPYYYCEPDPAPPLRSRWLRAMMERHCWHGIVARRSRRRMFLLPLLPRVRWRNGCAATRHAVTQHNWLDGEALRPHLGAQRLRDRARIDRPAADRGTSAIFASRMTQSSNLTMLLHWEDRNSMAHGIEARVPFLDHRLVEFSIAPR